MKAGTVSTRMFASNGATITKGSQRHEGWGCRRIPTLSHPGSQPRRDSYYSADSCFAFERPRRYSIKTGTRNRHNNHSNVLNVVVHERDTAQQHTRQTNRTNPRNRANNIPQVELYKIRIPAKRHKVRTIGTKRPRTRAKLPRFWKNSSVVCKFWCQNLRHPAASYGP